MNFPRLNSMRETGGKLLIWTKFIGVLFLAVLSVGCSTHHRVEAAKLTAADPFIGKWRLDATRSSRTAFEQEYITITSEDGGLKLAFDGVWIDRSEFHHWVVTDAKGSPANLTQADGRRMSDVWCITQNAPDSMTVESFLGKQILDAFTYKLSADGSTMTIEKDLERSGLIGAGPSTTGARVLVFERVGM